MKLTLEQVWPRLLRRTVGRLGWLSRLNLTVPVTTRQGTVRVPFLAGQAVELAGEPWMTEILARLLPLAPGTFVDVGVNLGQTLLKVRLAEPARRIVGFEPNPSCVAYVRELIRANGFTGIEIVPTALFLRDGILGLDLFSPNEADSAASVIPDFRPGERVHGRINVPGVTWETATRTVDPGRLGVVKIDVEGAELDVLETMAGAIGADRPAVLMEVLPAYRPDNRPRIERQTAIERFFAGRDYRLFRIEKRDDDDFDQLVEVSGFGVHGDLRRCDYLMLPAEMVVRVARAFPLRPLGTSERDAGTT